MLHETEKYLISTVENSRKREPLLMIWIRQLRVAQWVKNVLVFLPAVAGHQLGDKYVLTRELLLFIAFCCVASGVYLVNDLLDYRADCLHPRKRQRPIPAGLISLRSAVVAATALLVLGSTAGFALDRATGLWLIGYAIANLAYSLYIKKTLIADIILLTGFYLVRVLAGGSATGIVVSPWLLAFCFALFFSLAACKRYSELNVLEENHSVHFRRRAYLRDDASTIHMIGVAAAFSAVLILGLYVDSASAKSLYRHPELLWLCCPLLLYWLLRLWVVAGRGKLPDDPLVVATSDWRAWLVATLFALIFIAASNGILGLSHIF